MPALSKPAPSEIGGETIQRPAEANWLIPRLLRRYWLAFLAQHQRHRLRVALRGLSERELMDIGITSAEIESIAAHRAIDRLRDGTANPWMR